MNKVYVRWYGNMLEGEVVENRRTDQLADMVAVRIPIQGVHATALFTPGHVYTSMDEASQQAALIPQQRQVIPEKGRVIDQERQVIAAKAPSEAWMSIQQFKQDHWDHERNHLRIDALDEFYQLWCMNVAMRIQKPQHVETMKIEAPSISAEAVPFRGTPAKRIVSDQKMEELKTQLKKTLKPVTATQLSLFD